MWSNYQVVIIVRCNTFPFHYFLFIFAGYLQLASNQIRRQRRLRRRQQTNFSFFALRTRLFHGHFSKSVAWKWATTKRRCVTDPLPLLPTAGKYDENMTPPAPVICKFRRFTSLQLLKNRYKFQRLLKFWKMNRHGRSISLKRIDSVVPVAYVFVVKSLKIPTFEMKKELCWKFNSDATCNVAVTRYASNQANSTDLSLKMMKTATNSTNSTRNESEFNGKKRGLCSRCTNVAFG